MGSQSLKYYRQVSPEDASIGFQLKRMEDIYDRAGGKPDLPHRHGYFSILWVVKAMGIHRIDFHEFSLGHRQVFFIEPGQIHQLIEEQRPEGYVMTFSRAFLIENRINTDLIRDLFIHESYGYSPPLKPNIGQWSSMEKWIKEMELALSISRKFRYEAIGSLLKLFLIQCQASCSINKDQHTQDIHSSMGLVRSFRSLLEDQYGKWHKVSHYAGQLHITPDYLNSVLKAVTGKGAKEHIQDRIITEARRLFLFTDLSIKEVGYQLGFNEPAHFSSFFKKCMGVAPSVYLSS